MKYVGALERYWNAITDEERDVIEAETNEPPPGVAEEPNMIDREKMSLGSNLSPRMKL
jgi:hypothetical protein